MGDSEARRQGPNGKNTLGFSCAKPESEAMIAAATLIAATANGVTRAIALRSHFIEGTSRGARSCALGLLELHDTHDALTFFDDD